MTAPASGVPLLQGRVDRIEAGRVEGWLSVPPQGRLRLQVEIAGRTVGTAELTPADGSAPDAVSLERMAFTVALHPASVANALAYGRRAGPAADGGPDPEAGDATLEVMALALGGRRPGAMSLDLPDGFVARRPIAEWTAFFGLTSVADASSTGMSARRRWDEGTPADQRDLPADPEPVVLPFGELEREIRGLGDRRSMPADLSARLLESYRADLAAADAKVLSLDVFDTLLLRDDMCEARRFLEMSEQAADVLGPDGGGLTGLDLLLLRVDGMRFSYWTRPAVEGCREGSIDEVYRHIGLCTGARSDVVDRLRQVELGCESRRLVANATLVELARRFRDDGGRVVLVSDMYLGAEAIGELVARAVPGEPAFDAIFSSGDEVLSKASGKLYGRVAERLGVARRSCFHIGDNVDIDYRRAREAGWQARLFPISTAEIARRQEDLTSFLAEMREQGIDARGWAKR